QVNGGAGDDLITADYDGKANRFNGGDGTDRLEYHMTTDLAVDVTIDLSDGGGDRDIGGGTRLSNLAQLSAVLYTAGKVEVVGGSLDDAVAAGFADDTLSGRLGNDTLIGNEGNDSLSGGAGADTLEGGSGEDRLDSGTGRDTFLYFHAAD